MWAAITTVDGWTSWAVPVAWIAAGPPARHRDQLQSRRRARRRDQYRERIHRSGARRKLAFHTIKAPAGFPHFDALRRVTQTFELTPEGSGTRVALTGTGYGADASGQAVLAFFKGGNRVSLEMLRDRFASGPIDWTEKLKKPLK